MFHFKDYKEFWFSIFPWANIKYIRSICLLIFPYFLTDCIMTCIIQYNSWIRAKKKKGLQKFVKYNPINNSVLTILLQVTSVLIVIYTTWRLMPIFSSSNNKRHILNAVNQMFQIACVPLKIKTNLRIYYSRWKLSWKLLLWDLPMLFETIVDQAVLSKNLKPNFLCMH